MDNVIDYEYEETPSKEDLPEDGFEFWGFKITVEEKIAVWRRVKKELEDGE